MTHIADYPTFFRQGCKLVEGISAARVQTRTSKGITDLLLPQTSLRWTHNVPLRNNQIRIILDTIFQAKVSFVNGINQTNHSTN